MTDAGTSPTAALEVPSDPSIGTLIGERYRVIARIGEGGMGAVYRAEHVLMKKTVALKLLHRELSIDDAAKRFEREAQSASRLSHPNIIAVTDFGRAATGELFLVMEYVPGASVADRLVERGRLPVAEAVALMRQVLGALDHAHRQGVVHRDLKPANIMLSAASGATGAGVEQVKILDFGIAKITADLAEGEVPLTQGAMVFGTPSYMSPEQATAGEVDARADLYACGVILYELLTGRKPFVAEDAVKVMTMQVTATPPSFASAAPDARIPSSIEAVVMRALEKDRNRRYQSAAAFLEALEQAETSGSMRSFAQRAGSATRPMLGAVRRWYAHLPWTVRRWVPLGGVVAVVLLLVIVPSIVARRPSSPQSVPPRPKPVEPVLAEPLRRIQDALSKGKLPEARAMILQQLHEHPREARLHYQLGTLEFVEKRPAAGLAAYGEALKLDPGLRGDAALLLTVKGLLDDKRFGRAALDLMIERIGRPAAETLVDIASSHPRLEFRQAARAGCKEIGVLDRVDLVASYALDLKERSCDVRREAARGLGETGDKRAIEVLRKAKNVGGPLAGLFGAGNSCARREIEAALKALED